MRGSACCTAVDGVGEESLPEGGLALIVGEGLGVEVLEGEVEGLRGEVPDHVREVPLVVGTYSLLLVQSSEAVQDAFVGVSECLLLDEGLLQLEADLDDFDGRGD